MKNIPFAALYDLIQEMTKEEKRYFKLFAKSIGGPKSHYLLLFDWLNKMPQYEEVALKQKAQKQGFANQISTYKQYLYHLILKSLQTLHQEASIEEEILTGLKYLKILYRKRLFNQVDWWITQLIEICVKYDKLFYLPRLREWQLLLQNGVYFFAQVNRAEAEYLLACFQQSIQALEDYVRERLLMTRANYLRLDKAYARDQEDARSQVLQDYLQRQVPQGSPLTQVAYWQGQALARSFFRNEDSIAQAWEAVVSCVEGMGDWEMDSDLKKIYVTALYSILGYRQAQPQAFALTYHKLQKIADGDLPKTLQFYRQIHILLPFLRYGHFEQAFIQWKVVEQLVEGSPTYTFPKLLLMVKDFCLALVQFGLGEHHSVLDAIQGVLLHGEETNEIIYNTALLLQIIVYYEQGETLLMPYAIRSLYRSLLKSHHLFDVERLMLRYLRRLSEAVDQASRQRLLSQLQKSLGRYDWSAAPVDRELLCYFDYMAWVESKLQQQSFGQWCYENLGDQLPDVLTLK